MANYVSTNVGVSVSTSSDGSSPYLVYAPSAYESSTSPTQIIRQNLIAIVGGVSVSLDSLTTVDQVIVKNADSTGTITVTFDSASAGATIALLVPAGQFLVLTDVDPTQTFTVEGNVTDCAVELIAHGV